jgi:hypothetical protein
MREPSESASQRRHAQRTGRFEASFRPWSRPALLATCWLACGCGEDSAERDGNGGSGGSVVQAAGGGRGGSVSKAGAGSSPGGSGTAAAGGSGPIPEGACAELRFEEDVTAAGRDTDKFTWSDAACRPRTAAMARVGGGYLRQFSYEMDGAVRIVSATDANGHPGWGFSVNHELPGGTVTHGRPGTFKPLFVGAHHAIYEYHYEAISQLPVTLHWLFSSGRSHPVLAITYDLNAQPKGLGADSRTPYGDIAWDGDDNAGSTVVSGVGWGDRYKFITTTAPLTMDSTWDYTEPNLVPYVLEWADASDAEMGAVQTQTHLQKDAGGYWFYANWGKTSENQTKSDGQIGNMPVTWNWPYQLNQYELCIEDPACLKATTGSHRLAWGANYGAIGGADESGMYAAYGDDKQLSGWPYQSYSVFMVLDRHSAMPVFAQAREVEIVQKTTLTASVGSVVAMVPGGVGRSDLQPTDPPGYDHRYSTWNVQAEANSVAFKVEVSEGSLSAPTLVVSRFSGTTVPSVFVDGVSGIPDVTFMASVVPEREELWLTFRPGWSGTQQIRIE